MLGYRYTGLWATKGPKEYLPDISCNPRRSVLVGFAGVSGVRGPLAECGVSMIECEWPGGVAE